jgi:hypothetical protein
MRLVAALLLFSLFVCPGFAQNAPSAATVPITLDHNRIIIDVYFPMPDGTRTRVRGWVDNGNPDLWITERLAKKLGLELSGEPRPALDGQERTAQAPREMQIGGMTISLAGIKDAQAVERNSIGPGLSAEVNLPSTVLRNYDVLIDYPNREFTIAAPGAAHFQGTATKVILNSENALIQIAGNIGGEKQNLGLDVGATVSLVSSDAISKWSTGHPTWPHMTGAVGPANLWGLEDEAQWKLLCIPQMQYGGVTLTQVVAASLPQTIMAFIEKRAGGPTVGLIGADALLNYRVGLDYAHSAVYFQQVSKLNLPDMDVVGLVLRPESDGSYSVLGVADYEGKPSVPEVQKGDVLLTVQGGRATGATMGQVWSLLSGSPGDTRTLVLERAGKQFTVSVPVRRFLNSSAAEQPSRKKAGKKK